jgi:hypothetical protein
MRSWLAAVATFAVMSAYLGFAGGLAVWSARRLCAWCPLPNREKPSRTWAVAGLALAAGYTLFWPLECGSFALVARLREMAANYTGLSTWGRGDHGMELVYELFPFTVFGAIAAGLLVGVGPRWVGADEEG